MVNALRAAGHDVFWVRTHRPGSRDSALLDLAETDERIVITLDKDFWQVSVQRRVPLQHSGVVLFRVHPTTSANLEPLVKAFVEADAIWAGHISIISAGGIQMLASHR